ncbi:MAG: CynX/NimT family MFS transporter [Haloarculaceae archaeon]
MRRDATAETVTPGSWVLLALGSLAYLLYTFSWFLLAAFLDPIAAGLGLSPTQAGIVAGAVPLSYVPLALASGLLVDRIGPARAIGGGSVLVGLAQVVRASATGFPALLVPTLLIGVGGTGLTFGLPKLAAERFPGERLSTASAVYLVGSTLGTAAAFGLGRPLLGPALGGWRPVFRWTGLLVVAYALAWLAAARVLGPRLARFGDDGPSKGLSLGSARADVVTVLSHPQLRLLVVVGAMQLFLTHGLQAWLPTVLGVRGLGADLAATATSLLVVARLAGTLTLPPLADRLAVRRATIVACGALAAVGTAGLAGFGASLAGTVAVVGLVGIGIGGLAPLVRALPTEFEGIGQELTATANGLIFTVGEVGGFAGPFVVGGLRDVTGSFAPGLAVLGAGAVLIVLAGASMAEPG